MASPHSTQDDTSDSFFLITGTPHTAAFSQPAFSQPNQSIFSQPAVHFQQTQPTQTNQTGQQYPNNVQSQQFQQFQTATISANNAKFPYLEKEKYEIWAMKMEYWIQNADHNLWRIVQQGNSPKRLGKDAKGNTIVHPPVSLDEHVAVQRENKVRTLLLQALPEDHMPDFHHYDDARDIWMAVKARFGGNEESKKMRKTMLKQQFTEFSVTEEEGLHKGYDRFQKILSQLNQVQARPDNDDINLKFLRALPSSWSQVALALKTRGGLESMSFDDLYNKLRSLELDVRIGHSYGVKAAAAPTHSAFIGAASSGSKLTYSDQQSIVPSVSQTSGRSDNIMECVLHSFVAENEPDQDMIYEDFDQVDQLEMEELDLKWQMAMLSLRINRFEKKAGRKMNYNNKQPARFDRRKVRCYKCLQLGHFARECNVKTVDDKARYSAFKVTEVKTDEPKALVSVDSMVNWSDHAVENKTGDIEKVYGMMARLHADNGGAGVSDVAAEFAMMGISPKVQNCPLGCDSKINDLNNMYNNLDRLYNDCYIKVQAYQNAVKTLESQKDWYHKTQIALEEKIRVLSANLENTTNTLSYTEKLHDQAQKEKKEWEVKFEATLARFEKWKESSKNLKKLINSSMSTRTKIGLGFKEYFGKDEVFDLSTPSVMYPEPVEEVKPLYSWFVKAGEMHAVPPSITGTYMPTPYKSDIEETQLNLEYDRNDIGIVDSGCSRSMTGNKEKLDDFVQIKGGIVKFGGGDGRISGKGTIRTSKLDFENVYYVEELQHFNLFSVSQICDKKNKVLFTDTACLVLSEEFQLPDKNQVVLRIPREHDLYTFRISDLQPEQKVTCLVAKASLDESTRWHRRMAHVNFKTINKLAKEGLVDGLPLKVFTMNTTCVACNKGKHYGLLYNVYFMCTQETILYLQVPKNQDSNSDVEEQVIVVPSFPSNSFAGPSSSNGPSIMERNADYAEELAKLQRQDQAETEIRNQSVSADRDPAGIGSAGGVSAGSTSVGSDPAGSHHAGHFQPAGCDDPAALGDPAVSTSVSADFIPVHDQFSSGIFTSSSYDDDFRATLTNLAPAVEVNPVPTKRVNTIHPQSQILGDLASPLKHLEDTGLGDAMQEEMQQFINQQVWKLVPLPAGKHAIGTKWILKNKRDARGIVVRNKARLVAQGHRQEEGIDYDEVFAPVARIEAIRLFLAFASYMGFLVYQLDVKSAFLYGEIEEEVYVTQPKGFEDPYFPKHVYRVVKALYGLHQAPRAWYARLSAFLLQHNYRRGTIDKTLFIKKDSRDILLVQVYVDDIIFGSTNKAWCDEFEVLMKGEFEMSAMGEMTFFLGLQVKQLPDGIFISQDKYVKDMLTKFDMESVRTATTPYEAAKTKLKDETDPLVNCCSKTSVTPLTSHLMRFKKIFKYLKGQPKLGLWYPKDSPFQLEAYSDSDYAGSHGDRKSTTGGCQFLGRRLISWQCKKQTIVATSSTEAEYVAAASCCAQVLWIQNQLLDYGFNFMNTKIFIDNQSTICIVKNPVFHQRTKHIEIRHHFIRDANEKNLIQVLKIHTDENVADLLTKAFDGPRFEYLVVHIGMVDMLFCGILFSCDCRSSMLLLVVILSAGRLVSAGRTMVLLVVILSAGHCFASMSHYGAAGSYPFCWTIGFCWSYYGAAGSYPFCWTIVILSAGRLVSAGRTMVLLVVILSAGCSVSAGSYGFCCCFRVHDGGHTSAVVYAANTSIHAAGLVCAGGIMFLLADLFLLVVTCFCCAQLDIAGWLVYATSHLDSAGSLHSCWCNNVTAA
ncbi:putative ribonuclease H-like domain-containing protein [Tanacetum coccineum]